MAHHSPGTVSDFQYSPKSFTSNVTRPKRSLPACQFWQLTEEGGGSRMAAFFPSKNFAPVWIFLVWYSC